MKKIINMAFTVGLVIWFVTAFYLSVNSIIDIFVDTNPYIAKIILASSFIWTLGLGIYNKYNGTSLTQIGVDLQKSKEDVSQKTGGCKTCGKKK